MFLFIPLIIYYNLDKNYIAWEIKDFTLCCLMITLCSLIATYGSTGVKSNDTVPLKSGLGVSSTTFFSFGGGLAFLAFGSGATGGGGGGGGACLLRHNF
jgi:hypothetical protein